MGKSRKHTPQRWERLGDMAALGAVVAPAPAAMNTTMNTTATTMNTTTASPSATTTPTATTAPATATTPAAAPAITPAPSPAAAPAAKGDLDGKVVRQWLLDHEVKQGQLLELTLGFLGILPESCSVQPKAGNGQILMVVGPAADILAFYHKGKGEWVFHSPTQAAGGLVTLPVMGLNKPNVIRETEVKTVVVPPPPKTGFAGLVDREIVGGVTVGQVATAGVAVAGAYAVYQNREAIYEGIKAIPSWFGFGKKEES